MSEARFTSIPLFRGIDPAVVRRLIDSLPTRSFAPGEHLCREGQPGSSMFIIQRGLVHVSAAGVSLGRRRRGDVIGEVSLLTGGVRIASVEATVATDALELDQARFAAALSRHPELLANLTRILSERLARSTHARSRQSGRGEAVTLVVGVGLDDLADDVIKMVVRTSPGTTTTVELRGAETGSVDRLEHTLAALDDLLAMNATVTILVPAAFTDLALLTSQTDRTLVLAHIQEAHAIVSGLATTPTVEAAVIDGTGDAVTSIGGVPVVRTMRSADDRRDTRWLGRHLSRTKLGLALGAGGAKGYAHVGAVRVLEEAGYEIDYVSGSSIGAVVGVCLGLGMTSHDIEHTMRGIFTPESVNAMFTLSFAGTSSAAETMRRMLHAVTGDRTFQDLDIPVVVMTVDLDAKIPQPIDDGSLLDALLAATALAGFVRPFPRGDQRLIDAVALVPVPSDAVRAAGADIAVSSNIMSRRTLPVWPGNAAPESAKKRERMLDVLLEVMDLAQLDSSIRHASRADVVLTPVFGPATWRSFDLADLFLAAGRAAAVEQLPVLAHLFRPPLEG